MDTLRAFRTDGLGPDCPHEDHGPIVRFHVDRMHGPSAQIIKSVRSARPTRGNEVAKAQIQVIFDR